VLKKKYRGRYYTMAYARMFTGALYERTPNPSLLPNGLCVNQSGCEPEDVGSGGNGAGSGSSAANRLRTFSVIRETLFV